MRREITMMNLGLSDEDKKKLMKIKELGMEAEQRLLRYYDKIKAEKESNLQLLRKVRGENSN
jgi:hypothetical protein